MNESVIIQKLIQVGQMLERGKLEYSGAEADIKYYLEQYAALRQADVMLSLPDIRNKLSPIKNLIAMLENGLAKGNIEMHDLVIKEIEACKESIAYLSGNGA